jgi:hypothetical protein
MRNPHECRALVNTAVRKVLNGNATADAIRYAVLLSSSGNWTFADEGAHPAHVTLGAELAASRTPNACNANLPTMNDPVLGRTSRGVAVALHGVDRAR